MGEKGKSWKGGGKKVRGSGGEKMAGRKRKDPALAERRASPGQGHRAPKKTSLAGGGGKGVGPYAGGGLLSRRIRGVAGKKKTANGEI